MKKFSFGKFLGNMNVTILQILECLDIMNDLAYNIYELKTKLKIMNEGLIV